MGQIIVALTPEEIKDAQAEAERRGTSVEEICAGRLRGMAKEKTRKRLALYKSNVSLRSASATYEELPDAVYPFDMTLGTFQAPAKAHPASTPIRLALIGDERAEIPVSQGRIIVDDGIMTIELTMPGGRAPADDEGETESSPKRRPPRRVAGDPPFNANLEGGDIPEEN